MDYCGPRGIAHSVFLGWDEADQDKALWWQLRENQRCKNCGTHPDEWNDELGGDRHAYRPEERVCRGCQETDIAGEALERARKQGIPKYGAHIMLIRNLPDDDEDLEEF